MNALEKLAMLGALVPVNFKLFSLKFDDDVYVSFKSRAPLSTLKL